MAAQWLGAGIMGLSGCYNLLFSDKHITLGCSLCDNSLSCMYIYAYFCMHLILQLKVYVKNFKKKYYLLPNLALSIVQVMKETTRKRKCLTPYPCVWVLHRRNYLALILCSGKIGNVCSKNESLTCMISERCYLPHLSTSFVSSDALLTVLCLKIA